jgi:ABC-type amino acid transport substrate-binding protein
MKFQAIAAAGIESRGTLGRSPAWGVLGFALTLALTLAPTLVLTLAAPAARAEDLVVLVDTGTEMPMAEFQGGQLTKGMHKDLGQALAARMGRGAVFHLLPRKRIALALEAGQADIICMYVRDWLPGKFLWSEPFFPMTEVVVSDTSGPRPRSLKELYGKPIATVLGYSHPELEQVLGAGFVRDDGASSVGNLRKMAIGRRHHVLTQQSTLDYHQKVGDKLSVYPPLVVKTYLGQCAVSGRGHVGVAEVNQAIAQLLRDGGISRIVAAYR